MKKITTYLLFLAVFASCNNEKKESKNTTQQTADTLSYTFKTVEVFTKSVKKGGDTSFANIHYPLFKDEQLNAYVKRQVFDFFDPQEQATSYQAIANSFISGYEDFKKENPETTPAWYLKIDIRVLKQLKNYIALSYQQEDFAGGAHGNTYKTYLNYDTKAHSAIDLATLFDENHKKELLAIAEKIFRKNEGLSPSESLTANYFFENGKFDLAKNFYIGDKGLVFLYNPYEIKPYVNGTTALIVPFTAIKGLSKPNSILSTLL